MANHFVNDILGLSRSQTTTQIEHYDNLAALFDVLKRINTILIDLDRDMWTYISMEYFKQQLKEGEVVKLKEKLKEQIALIEDEQAAVEAIMGEVQQMAEGVSDKTGMKKKLQELLSCPQNLLMLQSNFLLVMEDGS